MKDSKFVGTTVIHIKERLCICAEFNVPTKREWLLTHQSLGETHIRQGNIHTQLIKY